MDMLQQHLKLAEVYSGCLTLSDCRLQKRMDWHWKIFDDHSGAYETVKWRMLMDVAVLGINIQSTIATWLLA